MTQDSESGDQYRGQSWERSLAFSDAAAECERAARETRFADEISQDRRRGYRSACRLIAMSLHCKASRAAPDMIAAAPSTSVREEVEYEVWQDDAFGDGEAMVAGSTNLADAQHYAAVYSQDGPAWVVEVTRRHFRDDDLAALVPSTDEGKRHG